MSRGTREQLFLSLRLALASSYARRGSPLPLVLDDVLVNFDADRAKAAAAVLRDFAAEGHQLLVFTCHEHIHKLFKSLKVPVSQLPSNAEPGPAVITLQPHAEDEEKPKREKQPPRRRAQGRRQARDSQRRRARRGRYWRRGRELRRSDEARESTTTRSCDLDWRT